MKIHLAWIRRTATAAIVAGAGVTPAAAQYAPYRPLPQPQAAQPVGQQPAAQQPAGQQQAVPQQVAQQPVAQQQVAQQPAAPVAQTPYVAWQQQMGQPTAPYRPAVAQYSPAAAQYAPTTGAYPQTAAPYVPTAQHASAPYPAGYPSYPAVARHPNGAAHGELGPMPAPEAPANGGPNGYNDYANGEANGHNGPANGHNGHVNGHNGHVNGYSNGYYSATPGGECQEGHVDYGLSSYFDNPFHDSQWFGGVYFLFMERDNATPVKLTVEVDHAAMPDPYYPEADRSVLGTHFVDHDYREGVEARIGSTFTIGEPCDTGCYNGYNGCAPCAPDVYAWEVAWWGLDDDVEAYTFVEEVGYPTRIYGMKNFVGLEYDRDGAGAGFTYRPVNEYYGYGLPIPDPGAGPYADGYLAVLAQHVRTNFKAQNLELNIFRFPVCEVACNGCNSGYNGGCDGAYGCEEQCCPSSFSMYGSCGVRYFRVDDDFMYANEFAEWTGGVADKAAHDGFYDGESNELYYDVQVDNHLVGAQVGWTMNYNYACKWNFFCNSTFGLFNNHIEHMQQMWGGGGGDVRFTGSGEDFYVESSKNDIAMMGELRLGGSYDITCNWRAVMAYRAVAIAGLATSTDQIPDEFTNPEWVAIIDSDNSMIIHGVQVGAECRY